MAEVIGVRFKEAGKVYYFDPEGQKFDKGCMVIVETARGVECGEVALENREINDEEIVKPLRKLIRAATEDDIRKVQHNREREKEALVICQQKIEQHALDMKLVDVNFTFDDTKVLFYFTAENRVDFRELVKDLAGIFRMRIELRQIGVRDEAKMLGGLGICGRPFCCNSFLGEFQPVSIKMAKEQGLSLKYEQDAYEHLLKITPKPGAIVETPEGAGTVVETSLLTGKLKVQLHNNPDAPPKYFSRKETKTVRDAKIRVAKEEIEALKDIEG